ncbi:pilus (MSHA type) biogenesis protein MshL [Sphaerotilus montanus]|uniref:MSHA biogenesis protein MshL n=1 Tax=Sphaerotilus montanus TaxID=522889 RepID=A0A7Y9R246_9BURK|nr:pilus (MSHA type) biogenesis protein MshL [Sphaerotilus montanus]NYG34133.1 MSHA biogenesis protein MshL [Sphaerotilus montanus]
MAQTLSFRSGLTPLARAMVCGLLFARAGLGLAASLPLAPPLPATVPAPASAEGRFDLSVNQAPASQVFLQIAAGSPWQVLLSPEVTGTVSLSLRDTTVLDAMDAMRELYGYHYRISGRRIYVQPNTVQTRVFRINYLPGRRQGTSDIRVTSSSISQVGGGGNGTVAGAGGNGAMGSNTGNGNGSTVPGSRQDDTAHVRTTSDADFWRDVQGSLSAMLTSDTQGSQRRSVIVNASAGVIVVRATPLELRQIAQYLEAVQVSIERQVMLEAKILEVELSKDAQTGVNWSAFGRFLDGALSIAALAPGITLSGTGQVDMAAATTTAAASGKAFYGVSFQNANFSTLLTFLETQGRVQVLSSPRIATINNQKAVLKVGSDELYVTGVSSTISSTGSSTTSVPSVTLQPFFSGIALDVTPQIDKDGMVMLHVHPSISTVTEKQKSINLGSLGSYKLPLAASTISETDSIVRVRDGQIVAIGGLMQQEQREENSQVPGLGDAPVVGGLFRQKATVMRKRELVILMKTTVIHEDSAWPEADARIPDASIAPFPDAKRGQ